MNLLFRVVNFIVLGPHVMEQEVLESLRPIADVGAQQRALAYLDQIKNSEVGWQFCMTTLTNVSTQDDHLKFFCLQVMENYIRNHYNNTVLSEQQRVREFLSRWIQLQCGQLTRPDPSFLRNKAAQVFALVFVRDYPLHWPDFFGDLIKTLSFGTRAADVYIRVLKAIDGEVADKDITRTQQEAERNAAIKNAMRGSCVEKLVESWYLILKTYESSNPGIVNQCLEVIGAYVSWIDITLVANDRFIAVLLSLMPKLESRESAVDCLHDIINKGMEPLDKLQLIETLVPVLQNSGNLKPLKVNTTETTEANVTNLALPSSASIEEFKKMWGVSGQSDSYEDNVVNNKINEVSAEKRNFPTWDIANSSSSGGLVYPRNVTELLYVLRNMYTNKEIREKFVGLHSTRILNRTVISIVTMQEFPDIDIIATNANTAPTNVHTRHDGVHTRPDGVHTRPADVGTITIDVHSRPAAFHKTPADVGTIPIAVHSRPAAFHKTPADVGTIPIDVHSRPAGVGTIPIDVHSRPVAFHKTPASVGTIPIDVHSGPADVGTIPIGVHSRPAAFHKIPAGVGTIPTDVHKISTYVHKRPTYVHNRPADVDTIPTDVKPNSIYDDDSLPNEIDYIPMNFDSAQIGGGTKGIVLINTN